MAALNGPASTDLRVNLLKADRGDGAPGAGRGGRQRGADTFVAARPASARAGAARQPCRLQAGPRRGAGRKLTDCRAARRCAARYAGRRFLRRSGRQDLGARRRNGQSRQARRLRGVAAPPRARRAPAAPRRRHQCRAPCADRRARQMGQAPRRRLRPGLRRCALSRHRDVAAQPRRQMAHAARGSRRARRTPAADPAQRRAARPSRRTPDLRDLLVAARGRRGAGRSLSRGRARFFAAARRACLGRDDRRRLAGRRAIICG